MLPSIVDPIIGSRAATYLSHKIVLMAPKVGPKRHQQQSLYFAYRFVGHRGSIVGEELGTCWRHFSANMEGAKQSPCFSSSRSRIFPILGCTGLVGIPHFLAARPDGCPIFGRFWTNLGTSLALSWVTWPQDLARAGLAGFREAARIDFVSLGTSFV